MGSSKINTKWIIIGAVVLVVLFFGLFWNMIRPDPTENGVAIPEGTSSVIGTSVAPSYPGSTSTTEAPVPENQKIPAALNFDGVDRNNPDAVLSAVLETISNVDTSKFYNPNYVTMTAESLLAGGYYTDLLKTRDTPPSGQWAEWSQQGVILHGKIEQLFEGGAPRDQPNKVSRMYKVTQKPVARNGMEYPEMISYVKSQLVHGPDGWLVATLVSSN